MPDQVIVNEYLSGQGIAAHVDHVDHFGGVIASLSLGSQYTLDFEHKATKRAVSVPLPVGSLVVLSGPARYEWTHGIAKRQTDGTGPARTRRGTRVSITFRTMLGSPGAAPATNEATAAGAGDGGTTEVESGPARSASGGSQGDSE